MGRHGAASLSVLLSQPFLFLVAPFFFLPVFDNAEERNGSSERGKGDERRRQDAKSRRKQLLSSLAKFSASAGTRVPNESVTSLKSPEEEKKAGGEWKAGVSTSSALIDASPTSRARGAARRLRGMLL